MSTSKTQKDALETIARFMNSSKDKAKRGCGEGRFHHGTVRALLKQGYVERTTHQAPHLGYGLILTDAGREFLENADKPKVVSKVCNHPKFTCLSPEEQEKRLALRAEFMSITRGVTAYTLARIMCRVTSGIDWCGCTKGHMADEWLVSWHRKFDDGTLSYYVRLLDEYLANEAERERGAKVYHKTMGHRNVIDWADSDTEKQQAKDIHESAEVELSGLPGMDASRSRSGLARRDYMEKRSNGRYYLTRTGWAAAARSLYFAAGSAQSKRNQARRNATDWGYRGNKNEQKRIMEEQDREYRRLITMAERALQRSQEPQVIEDVPCTLGDTVCKAS